MTLLAFPALATDQIVAFVAEGASYKGSATDKVTISNGSTGIIGKDYTKAYICTLSWTQKNSSQSKVDDGLVKWYAKDILSITPLSGTAITKIVINASSAKYAKALGTTCSKGSMSYKDADTKVTWTGSQTDSFTITASAQCRLSSVEVYYTAGTIVYPTECADPVFNIDNNAEVYPGQTITATCATLASTVSINGIDGETESGKATYTIPEDAVVGSTITVTAKAHAQGETELIYSNEKSITLKVIEAPKVSILTPAILGVKDSGYIEFSHSDKYADYKIICNLTNSNIGWNLGNKNLGKNSGIIIAAKDGYKIKSIAFNNTNANVKIFTNDEAYTNLAALANATAIATLQQTNPIYTFKSDVFYCGARPTNTSSMNFSSITVEFEALSAPEPPQEVHVTWTGLEGNAGLKTEPIALKVEGEFPLAATIEPEGAVALVDLVASSDAISVVKNSNGNWTVTGAAVTTEPVYVEATLPADSKQYFLGTDEATVETHRLYFTVAAKDPVPAAPKFVTFSKKEGYYTEGSLDVTLTVDPEAYPECQVYYTLDATHASEKKTPYNPGDVIEITPEDGANTVTLNVYAVNSEGYVKEACTYVLNATTSGIGTPSDPEKWYRVNNINELRPDQELIIVGTNHLKAVSTTQNNNNRGAVAVTFDEDGGISFLPENVAKFKLSGDTDNWTLSPVDGDGNAIGYMYTQGISTATPSSIWRTNESIDNTISQSCFTFCLEFDANDNNRMNIHYNYDPSDPLKNYNEYVAYNKSSNIWSVYNPNFGKDDPTSYDSPSFFQKGKASTFEVVEDLYLYQEKEEYVDDDAEDFAGYQEAAYRFTYDKANNEYTLSLPGLAGQFWIRDGKANHAGTFFGTDVNVANVADKPAAAPRRAAASQLDVNGNKYVEGENGVWHNLVWRQDEHAKFDTHTYNADATVASHNAIENPTITVKYVPGSHTNALMMITGNNVTTGVEGITNDADGGEAVYFNMQGLRVNEPQKGGVYVRIQNGKAVKITK